MEDSFIYVISFLAYLFLGATLSSIYCFSVGWDTEAFVVLTMLMPIIAFILLFAGALDGLIVSHGRFFKLNLKERKGFPTITVILLFWISLPLLMNLISKFFYLLEREERKIIYEYRYDSLIFGFFGFLIVSVILFLAKELRLLLSKSKKEI